MNAKVQFRHIRDMKWCDVAGKFVMDNMGGVTLAYYETENAVTFAAATCSIKENFSKAQGREIALKRLAEGQSYTVTKEAFHNFAFGRGIIPAEVPADVARFMEISTTYELVTLD